MAKKETLKGAVGKVRVNHTDGLFSTDSQDKTQEVTPSSQDVSQQTDEAKTSPVVTTTKKKQGRPPKDEKDKVSYYYVRTSVIANKEKLRKLEEIAYREKILIKELLEVAFDLVIDKYEKTHGEITEFTKGKPRDVKKRLFEK